MANAIGMYGLRPVKYKGGAPYNGSVNVYHIASTDINALAPGDPVRSSGTAHSDGTPGVTLATAGVAIRGVIISIGRAVVKSPAQGLGVPLGGAMVDPTALETTIAPATKTTGYYAAVCDDPNVIFACKESSSGTPLAATEVGLNANLAAGTNNGYVSGWYIDNGSELSTNVPSIRLLGLTQVPNNAFGLDAEWLILINDHELGNAARAGVA